MASEYVVLMSRFDPVEARRDWRIVIICGILTIIVAAGLVALTV